MQYAYSICSCARMEENSIGEWIDYHRSIGFDHFFIYGNDDDPQVLAEPLAPYIAARIVTFTHCPEVGAQVKMYLHFLRHYARSTEWLCFLDQDEYLRLAGFGNSVAQLTRQAGTSFDSIQLNWLNFGTSGYAERPPGSVLRQYTRRARAPDIHTKHITRTAAFFALPSLPIPFWHALPAPPVRTCSALLEPWSFWDWIAATPGKQAYLDHVARDGARLIESACVAHFHLKSEQDFSRRIERGLAGDFANQIMYRDLAADPVRKQAFIDDSNVIEDRYLADYWGSYLERR
ncbi:MAG TPA: glycosyltransferase family 2 protein [Steroidobacteraceae bacterium]|nr:glycosyltransferase family 2 protein [Steroidobacteraceae bacterium]